MPATSTEHHHPSDAGLPERRGPAPAHQRLLEVVLAVCIAGGPLGFAVGGILAPAIHDSGRATIAANAAADPTANGAHLAAFFAASFLLPIGAFGLAQLAYRSTPWLATIGGLLGVVGWLPYSALTALDDVAYAMAGLPDRRSYAHLLDVFTNDPVMLGFLLVYIIGHLVAYVLLGIALRRARVVPAWAAWMMAASSPLTMAVFLLPGRPLVVGYVAISMLAVGSLPAAVAMARGRARAAGRVAA
ncbi:MAG TPA: hypothetical protein VF049_19030 [Nocardioidaceae bacterium]|jgi:hypothetical protein